MEATLSRPDQPSRKRAWIVRAVFAAAAASCLAFWYQHTTTLSTVLGAVGAGMALAITRTDREQATFWARTLRELSMALVMIGLVVLYYSKETGFADWEPTAFQDGIWPTLILMVAWMVALGAIVWADPPAGTGAGGTDVADAEDENEATAAPAASPRAPRWMQLSAASLMALSGLAIVASLAPQWLSLPQLALHHHIHKDRPDQHRNLLAVLWTKTMPGESAFTELPDGRVRAEVGFDVPLPPFELTPQTASTRKAENAFFDHPSRQTASVVDNIVLRPNGLGWVVESDTRHRDPIALSKLDAEAKARLNAREAALSVGFAYWFATGPLAKMMAAMLFLIAVIMLLTGGRTAAIGAAACAVLSLLLSLGPLAIFIA